MNRKPVANASAPNAVVGVLGVDRAASDLGEGRRQGSVHPDLASGNPLVNEVIIPLGHKDEFNRTQPKNDAANYGQFVAAARSWRRSTALPGAVNAPETNRTDIVQAVLQGIPGLNAFPGAAGKNATDTLKINLGTPPTATPNRLGGWRGYAGYPNGRRLTDDAVDIDLQVVAGALQGNKVPLGDASTQNDVHFLKRVPVRRASEAWCEPAGCIWLAAQGHRQWERDLDAPIFVLRHRW